jgi:transcriptional regulator with XRE-family HTH domain
MTVARPARIAAPPWKPLLRGFGLIVRNLRTRMLLSQQDLATAAGVSQGAISRLEAGHVGSALQTVVQVLLVLSALTRRHQIPVAPPLQRVFQLVESLNPAIDTHALPDDQGLLRWLEAYRRVRPDRRLVLLEWVQPMARYLAGQETPD